MCLLCHTATINDTNWLTTFPFSDITSTDILCKFEDFFTNELVRTVFLRLFSHRNGFQLQNFSGDVKTYSLQPMYNKWLIYKTHWNDRVRPIINAIWCQFLFNDQMFRLFCPLSRKLQQINNVCFLLTNQELSFVSSKFGLGVLVRERKSRDVRYAFKHWMSVSRTRAKS